MAISSAVASRYDLKIGDTLSVFDPLTGESYDFQIRAETDYNVLLTVFMRISDLRSLLNKEGIAYNMIYSDTALDYSKDKLFSAATKEDLIAPVEALEPVSTSNGGIFCALAILFYAVVMIYLIQFAVIRSRKDIACLSAFGYGKSELIRFVTGRLFILICVSTAVSLFLGYKISVFFLPSMLASTPIGLMIDYHLPEYLLHLAGAFGIILVSVLLGMKRVGKTDTLFYLRSRE